MKTIKPYVTLLIVALTGLILVGVIGLYSFKESLIEAKKSDVAAILKIARTQSVVYIDQYKQGLLTKEQADQKIVSFLSALQYESAYVWANDDFGIARVHARKEVIGQFQKSYIEHMAQLRERDIFYLTKPNIKPVSNEIVTKMNGVTKLPEWNWVIGFGVYMDDINNAVFKTELLFIATVIFSLVLVSLVAIYAIKQAKKS